MNNRLLPHWKAKDAGLSDEALTALVRSNIITLKTDQTSQVTWNGEWDDELKPLLEIRNDQWTTGERLEEYSGLSTFKIRALLETHPECFVSLTRRTDRSEVTGTRLRLYRARLAKGWLDKLREEK